MRSLFIGRFQPFHNGHLFILKKALRESDSVIVAIGSAQFSNTCENPFSSGERMVMIQKVLVGTKAKEVYLLPLQDVGDDELWAAEVEQLVPAFEAVYTNNPIVRKLFANKGYTIKTSGFEKRKLLSGTHIRELIAAGKKWDDLVPKSVAKEIIRVDGVDRIRILMNE